MLAIFLTTTNSKYDPSLNVRGYYFPHCESLGHVSVTQSRVLSLIDAETLRRTTSTEQISTETCHCVPLMCHCCLTKYVVHSERTERNE